MDPGSTRPKRRLQLSRRDPQTERIGSSFSARMRIWSSAFAVHSSNFRSHTLIEFGFSDITIVDMNDATSWPDLAFRRFESKTEHHKIVILCSDAEQTSHDHQRSAHTVDILPVNVVDDALFPGLVQENLASHAGLDASSSAFTRQEAQQPPLPQQNIAVGAAA